MNKFRKIVENILKKHSITLNEDVKADYTLIKEAEVVWKAFVDHAKEDVEIIVDNINNQTNHEYEARVLDDLIIAIDWEDAKLHNEIGYCTRNDNRIQIHLMNVLYYPYNRYLEKHNITEKQFISALNSSPMKSVFLHEYQHYKYHNNDKTSILPHRAKTDDNGKIIYDKHYYTDPNEFNSFTLQDVNYAIKVVKKLLTNAIKNKELKPNDKNGIKAIIRSFINDEYANDFYANNYHYIEERNWHKHVIKRMYNMLYYLFVENNMVNAKKIYNNLKKQLIDEPTRVNAILSLLKFKFELIKKEDENIIGIYQDNKEKWLRILYKSGNGLDEKINEIAKNIAGKYFDSIEDDIWRDLNVKKINIK